VDDVGWFEEGFGEAALGDVEHGAADLLGGGDVARERGFYERKDGAEDVVEELVELCFGADAVEGLDEAGAEHVGSAEGEFEEVVFGAALDAGPHGAAAFAGVGSGAGDVDEGHPGVEAGEGGGSGESEVVGEVGVLCFGHAGGGDAETEEAGVEACELGFDGGVVEEVGVDEFAELGVLLLARSADDGEDLLDAGVEEAFAKDALADHAGCSEEDDVHGFMLQRMMGGAGEGGHGSET
jgi:hypothetical protein